MYGGCVSRTEGGVRPYSSSQFVVLSRKHTALAALSRPSFCLRVQSLPQRFAQKMDVFFFARLDDTSLVVNASRCPPRPVWFWLALRYCVLVCLKVCFLFE